MKLMDIAEKRFGSWTVLSLDRISKSGAIWVCRCDCGEIRSVYSSMLRHGKSKSCGCKKVENHAAAITTHGMSYSREYGTWANMIYRCENTKCENYHNYGGRGIKVCDRWMESFENFIVDMGKRPSTRHSIERKDNNGNYEPNNCRWATPVEQSNNLRRNRLIEHEGLKMNITQWSKKLRVPLGTISRRLHYGWSNSESLFGRNHNAQGVSV